MHQQNLGKSFVEKDLEVFVDTEINRVSSLPSGQRTSTAS